MLTNVLHNSSYQTQKIFHKIFSWLSPKLGQKNELIITIHSTHLSTFFSFPPWWAFGAVVLELDVFVFGSVEVNR